MKLKKICVPMGCAVMRLVVLIVALTTASFAQSVKLSVVSLTFSAQLIGTTSVTQSFTLTNTDSITPLAIDSISHTGDYSETDTCGTSLPPLGSCTIFVTFSPAVAGTIVGAITFQDEASNSPQIVSLSGVGLTPVSLSPTSLAFGTVTVGNKSVSKPVTLTDNQSTSLTFKFAASGDYTVIGSGTIPCGTTLAAHSSCTLAVTFQPTVNGSLNGALTITHNAEFSPQDVALSGTGSGGSNGSLTFSPANLSFGSVVVGTISAGAVVTVKNVSSSIVNITGFPASGNYTATGSGTTHCGGLLNPGQSCTFTVTFSPTLIGTVPGAVTVTDNAATSPQLLSLTGNGVQSVTLSPSSLTFPSQRLGTSSAAQIVTLTNNQAANTLVIDSIAASGDFSAVQVGKKPCGARVPALGSCTIGVVFSPAAGGGSITGALTVAYNASPSPGEVTLTATAKGTLPRFAYTNGDNTISSYTVDSATGQLRHTGYVLGGPNAVVATPSGAFVYGANFVGNVSAYSADAKTGTLTAVSGSPFAAEPASFAITVDPSSKFVYVANANSASNNISGYTINSTTGVLTQMSGSPFKAGNDTRAIVVVPNGKFLYAANATSNDVSAYTINATTGVLTQIAGSPFPVPPGNLVPQSIAVDPATKFVYVGSSDSPNVIAFTINPTTGALTTVAGSPFANPGGSNYGITVDPSDRFVYVANDSANSVSAYSINGSTGVLTPLLGSPFAAGTGALSVAVDPSGRFLYLPDIGSNNVFMFNIDSGTGVLKLSRTIHGRSGSTSIALASGTTPVTYTPKFAYVANNVDSNVSGYTIDPETGVLTAVPGSPFTSGVQPTSIAVDPSGRFAYTANFNDNDVSEYTINALSGALTPVSGSPVLAQTHPFSVTVDPSGRFAYVANSFSASISGYSISSSTGSLTALSGSPYSTGLNTQPFSVAIDPSGRFLCVAIENTNQVESFSIDATSGKLAAIGSVPTGMSPELVVVDPSGRFVYVADGDGHVSAYTISTAGSLTQITGSPFLAGHRTVSVAVDPSGRFVYAANNGNGAVASFNVSAYTIDPNTGALTEIIGSPFATGAASRSVAVDPSGNFVYVANTGTNDVSAYTIDQASGALTANPASPFPAGSFAYAVTTTTDIH
jgi:6-phosphogluconolactonase (cycloisomerase 2 family)